MYYTYQSNKFPLKKKGYKYTHTHTEYVILIALPRQQWLKKRSQSYVIRTLRALCSITTLTNIRNSLTTKNLCHYFVVLADNFLLMLCIQYGSRVSLICCLFVVL